ncbi:MAG: hypothetical protein AB7G11_07415 [Phycisphaerales bacterium]
MASPVEYLRKLLDTSDFPARWTCGNWGALEGWTHIVSDFVIFLAYVAIPVALFVFVRRRKDIAFPRIIWLFIAFILACGIGHGVETLMFWWPAYRLTGLIKVITAIVSVATVVALIRVLPLALSIPSLTREHVQLQGTLKQSMLDNQTLASNRADLERRTSELTIRERRIRAAVGSARAFSVMWNFDTGEIVWESGYRELLRDCGLQVGDHGFNWANVLSAQDLTRLRDAARAAWETRAPLRVRLPLKGYDTAWELRIAAKPDHPAISVNQRTVTGLVQLMPIQSAERGDPSREPEPADGGEG